MMIQGPGIPTTIATAAMTLPPQPYPRSPNKAGTNSGNRNPQIERRKAHAAEAEAECSEYASAMYAEMHW
jgi:hypothetical protein